MLKRSKILLIMLILATIAIVIVISIIIHIKKINCSTMTTDMAISKINEEYFDISINISEKVAIVDGKNINLTDLFAISTKELNEMLYNNTFNIFLQENLIGDFEYGENTITISNPYSTNSLIVEASNENIFDNYESISSVKQITEKLYIVKYSNASETKNGCEEFKDNEDITNIIKDHKVQILDNNVYAQSVSSENVAWGVSTTGLGHYALKLDYAENDEEITIAVLDTGINSSHQAFAVSETADKIDFNYSYNYINETTDVTDDNGHGTAVAGVIAESTSYNIKIVPIKILNGDGEGTLANILEAIEDVYKYVDVINLSLGMDSNDLSTSEKSVLEKFFKEVYNYGTIVVCAAGNESTDVCYPASISYTLAASAIDSNENIASFSNYGDEIDFALPGVSLKLPSYSGVNSYTTVSGTSFSSPFLASAVALVKADYNYTRISDIVDVLKENAEDLGDSGKDQYYGYGSINFDIFMFEKTIIVNIKTTDTDWAIDNNIIVKAISGSNIKYYTITLDEEEPSEWTRLTETVSNIELELKTTNNGMNYVWIKDENDNIVNANVEIKYVDNIEPSINKFEIENTTYSNINMTLSVQDNESGISEIKWYYKKSSEEQFNEIQDEWKNDDSSETGIITKSYNFTELESNTKYDIFAEITDIVGNVAKTNIVAASTLKKEGTLTIENKTEGLATVTIGENSSAEDFNILTDEEVIRVSCEFACIVILVDENEKSYTKLESIETGIDNEYDFEYEINDFKLIIVLKGDVNLNGQVNAADVMLINRSNLSSSALAYTELSSLQSLIADINENVNVNSSDVMLINRSLLSKTASAYLKLEW